MDKPKKVTRKETYYIQTCSVCNKEFRVSPPTKLADGTDVFTKDSEVAICYDCQGKEAYDKAIANGQFLIGAKIIKLEPVSRGHCTDIYQLTSLTVKTKEGQIIKFCAGGWDERYIEWEEVKEEV